MADIAGFPYFEVQVDKADQFVDPAEPKKVIDFLASEGRGGGSPTDLFVMSHGWNNDMGEARDLYKRFFAEVRKLMDNAMPTLGARRFAVLGVLWPSKKFSDEELIPGGAASVASVVTDAVIQKTLDGLRRGVFDNPKADEIIDKAKMLVPGMADSPAKQKEFADLVRSLPTVGKGDAEDASDSFFKLSGDEAMKRLSKPVMPTPTTRAGGGAGGATSLRGVGHAGSAAGAGGAAGLGSFFSGIGSAALNLLNYTTYYQMKERAGLVGRGAINDVLRDIGAKAPAVKLHLIGHSFGARLVTAVALGPDRKPPLTFASLTLLQAAFSHNGFALKFDGKHDGFFRDVVAEGRVAGPIVVTCSVHDSAVGRAYPIASLAAGQNAASLGDANDPYGGMGRNGAQHTPEANTTTLGAVGGSNAFVGGKVHNLNADALIANHSDICKPEVAYALLSAVEKS
ncbi:hypothetical protein [Variovorax sp. J31P207]|uniref:hypothetical protein n=1 Tax=Variovorax sp. J31P207 TaxID=3053510 RepID=UPI0025790D9D|nr:hypothetical protein [Variovorax sp. J31P207]MDM0065307.1 hypothetical protein [Variovorax sp. J31P207]